MLPDSGTDSENIRIENDILRRKPDVLGQQLVRTPADRQFLFDGIGLAALVERHDNDSGPIAPDQARLTQELCFALLEADRIDDTLALDALEPCFDHRPARGIDHHGHPRHIRFAGKQAEKTLHRRFRIEHPLIHVDVDHLRAVFDLLTRDLDRAGIIVRFDQPPENRGTGYVGTLADVGEQAVGVDRQRFQAREAACGFNIRHRARWYALNRLGDPAYVVRRGPATTTDHVEQALAGKLSKQAGDLFGRLLVFTELIGQTGVRMRTDKSIGACGKLF